jgi:hypothetical protein
VGAGRVSILPSTVGGSTVKDDLIFNANTASYFLSPSVGVMPFLL